MLKLVEIINTLPKKVCRVVLYAESKDDISQAALDEFQTKAGFTVAGGSFIYNSDKEISVTATDGFLLPLGDIYSISSFVSLDTLREAGLTQTVVDPEGISNEYKSWNIPGTKSVSFINWSSLSDEEKRPCLQNLLGMSLSSTGIGIKNVSELPDFIQQWEIQDDATFEAVIIPTNSSKIVTFEILQDSYGNFDTNDYSLSGLLKTMTVAEIKAAIEQGNAPEWYNVGKYK